MSTAKKGGKDKIKRFAKPSQEICALMLGLDGSGKTTLLYKWKLGKVVATIPTIGFNVENVTFGRCEVTIWDVGGQPKIRPLWRHYLQSTNVVVWVVDASDRTRIAESVRELQSVMNNDELKGVQLVVLANKCDLPSAMTGDEVAMGLNFDISFNPPITVIEVCAITGHNCDLALSTALAAAQRTAAAAQRTATAELVATNTLARGARAATRLMAKDNPIFSSKGSLSAPGKRSRSHDSNDGDDGPPPAPTTHSVALATTRDATVAFGAGYPKSPIVVSDDNPEMSRDESDVQRARNWFPMCVIFCSKIEIDTTWLQPRKKRSTISPSPSSVSTRSKGASMAMTSSWRACELVPRRGTGVTAPMSL